MYYKIDNYNDYLMHHQRLGAHWGIRNGPPYPLNQAFAKTKSAYKKHQEKVAAKKKKAILNNPEKLYKHKSDFTEEEIRSATSKAQAVEELRRQIPKKKNERKERKLGYATLSMVDTPDKFVKNQIYLKPEERKQAMEFLDNREKALRLAKDDRDRKLGTVHSMSQLVGNIKSLMGNAYGVVDLFASRNPNALTKEERHRQYLMKSFLGDDGDMTTLRFIASNNFENKKRDRKDGGKQNDKDMYAASRALAATPVDTLDHALNSLWMEEEHPKKK